MTQLKNSSTALIEESFDWADRVQSGRIAAAFIVNICSQIFTNNAALSDMNLTQKKRAFFLYFDRNLNMLHYKSL
jgi:hypothetical protein